MWLKSFLIVGLAAVTGCQAAVPASAPPTPVTATHAPSATASTRLVAVGIPGASAISPVGRFHPGGPIHDNAEFAKNTDAGRILDSGRILVASTSNFGAPRARADQADGGVLSIDPRGSEQLVVPANFAADGSQATTQDGRVQLFTAQSPAFVNRLTTPTAATSEYTSVSNPVGISINNAFGRIWFANVPAGPDGIGTETIIDPDGRPLANAPDAVAGGVFAGVLTNRIEQRAAGSLTAGAVANALLGRSPDGSTKAVFAVVAADGSLLQVHAQLGLDGLAPPGTVHPLTNLDTGRTGMVFNWTPIRTLYIADPAAGGISALTLSNDGTVFRLDSVRQLKAPELAMPVDLAPAVPEVANPDFSSNTTLAGGSDIYTLNRGNGTIARIRQDGRVVSVRQVLQPDGQVLGPGHLNGIAVSGDASTIWVTVDTVPGYDASSGAVLELAAFGAGSS
jgi:hypothetical protein